MSDSKAATWTLAVEHAPSGSSKCRACGELIDKGELRWNLERHPAFGLAKKHDHLACLQIPHKQANVVVKDAEEQVHGLDALREAERAKALEVLDAARRGTLKRPHPSPPASPSVKKPKPDSEDALLTAKFNNMNKVQLHDMLKLNNTMVTGTKAELVARCVDGERHGQLPPCPQCGKGMLALDADGQIACHGYFDESIGMRETCDFRAAPRDVKPRSKWLILGVDSKTHEQMEKQHALGALDDVDMHHVEVALEVVQDARPELQAQRLVEVARQMGIALPEGNEDDQLHKAGACLMESRCSGTGKADLVVAFLRLLARFGAAKRDPENDENRPKAKVEANARIADAIEELGELEAKARDSDSFVFRVRALKHAASQIRGLPFEIESGAQVSQGPRKVAGIGRGIGADIDQILRAGAPKRLIELRKRFPHPASKPQQDSNHNEN
ncbi:Poly [ADP-ribose] polymerase 1 (PARP-1) (NAD(+) ADP-ribosyltransferase 1) (ADPRT-1) (Poly[ADP-ribose] synthase 1) (Protein ADP-ribosyltransferase PARP1) [Durusdinium trenchii]|uniref:Poly [ADP-ribose] polymerase 1 (PARP-1) (NAD(+) ADP-ribosyltransferase 1) (ADPRT-1) (Poly[ADP-ribose] synthase 1) (Protein ADP-ribosyltransferase PARP1) n=1 Tax=Durusdinium trenchii TaxID=1381693 RepID=A0ABP0QYA6_9DINO